MQLKSLIFLASSIAFCWGVTPQGIESDLDNILSQVNTLDNDIVAFPDSGGSLVNALAIHTQAANTQSAVDATTSDVNSIPSVSETDAQAILGSVQALESPIEKALNDIVAKKAAFDGLPVGGISGLVLQDLTGLRQSTADLSSGLLTKSPDDLKPQGQAVADNIDNAFAAAIAAYS